jgi:uncharacterized membrane protein
MIDTFSVLTLQLAKAYGIYVLATGLVGLTAPDRWRLIMEDFQRSPGLTYVTAVIVFGLGIALVMLHNLWTDPLAVVVSLVGWVILVEGTLLMAAPEGLVKIGAATVGTPARSRLWAVFALIAGTALLLAGATGHASASP